MGRHAILAPAALAAAGLMAAALAQAAPQSAQRPGDKACREAANGLVSMLDARLDDTATYRATYAAVVETCGPASPAKRPKAPPPDRDACHDLAAALVDIIEDGKMNTPAFVQARTSFAQACKPR